MLTQVCVASGVCHHPTTPLHHHTLLPLRSSDTRAVPGSQTIVVYVVYVFHVYVWFCVRASVRLRVRASVPQSSVLRQQTEEERVIKSNEALRATHDGLTNELREVKKDLALARQVQIRSVGLCSSIAPAIVIDFRLLSAYFPRFVVFPNHASCAQFLCFAVWAASESVVGGRRIQRWRWGRQWSARRAL